MKNINPPPGKVAVFFQKALDKAKIVINDPEKLHDLLSTGREKILKLRKENKEFDAVMLRLGTAMRMIKAYKTKHYTKVPWKTIVMLTAGLVYFVMPLDLIPDFIPVAGFLDDATVMVWIFSSLRKEIEAFELWEQTRFSQN